MHVQLKINRIGGVIVNMLTSSVVDHGFIDGVIVNVLTSSAVDHGLEPLDICCFSA